MKLPASPPRNTAAQAPFLTKPFKMVSMIFSDSPHLNCKHISKPASKLAWPTAVNALFKKNCRSFVMIIRGIDVVFIENCMSVANF